MKQLFPLKSQKGNQEPSSIQKLIIWKSYQIRNKFNLFDLCFRRRQTRYLQPFDALCYKSIIHNQITIENA